MSLISKLESLALVAVSTRLPDTQFEICARRMAAGHAEHGDDCSQVDLARELRDEIADTACYCALSRMRGQWGWRLWLIAALSGLQWRLLRRL